MKIQCSCGSKFSFEVEPGMAKTGVTFVCPNCGLDSSEHVTRLVWQQLAASKAPEVATPSVPSAPVIAATPSATPAVSASKPGSSSSTRIRIPNIPSTAPAVAPAPVVARATASSPVVAPPQPPVAPAVPKMQFPTPPAPMPVTAAATSHSAAPSPVALPSSGVVRIQRPTPEAHRGGNGESEAEPELRCAKHAEVAEERCRICSKPICPKCMELFGYVCSPLCKAKADSHGIYVPEFAGQKSVKDRKLWRRTALIGGGIGVVVAGLLGFWFWYAWFGCTPRAVFAARFDDPAWSGEVRLATNDQVIVLHGDLLARYDMKSSTATWSRHLVDKKVIAAEVADEMKSAKKMIDKINNEDPDNAPRMPDAEKLQHSLEKSAAAALQLRVHGKSIWVASPEKLVRYDWDNGNPTKEIPLDQRYRNVIARNDELLLMSDDYSKRTITHVNMETADMRTEELKLAETPATPKPGATKGKTATVAKAATKKSPGTTTAGLPIGLPGKDAGKPLDPGKVAEQASHLPLPAKIALPAVLSGNAAQERTLAELNGPPRVKPGDDSDDFGSPAGTSVIPTKDGFLHFSIKLIEAKMVSRSAMKAAPAKSALEGNVTAGKSMEVANEILNEMQRSRGGDVVTEDQSRYEVTVQQPNSKTPWRGEVIGRPSIFPLKTVTAITGNKSVIVLDKEDKKLWQSTLTFNVRGSYGGMGMEDEDGETTSRYGQGPLVERGDTLFLFDEGVLSAFDLKTGNARWRIPSVGIAGIFFDESGMMYVNTTTASPDSIKYSRQIDISQKAISVVLKVDPKTGKTLWTAQPGGLITHVLGKYIYCVQYYDPKSDEMEESPYTVETGFETPAYLKIKRLNAKNGKEVWEHYQKRGPLDIQFDKNTIQLVFKKEVQVLKFLEL